MTNRIRQLREDAGLKQYELAAKMGIKQSSVHRWEYNQSNPTPDKLLALADLFDVSVDYILGRDTTRNGKISE